MQTNSSHPLIDTPLRLLDLTASLLATPTWQASPSVSLMLTCPHVPPLSFLLLADRLAELYEMVFPDRPDWLREEVGSWQNEEDVAAAVERFLQRVNILFPVHDEIWDICPSAGSGEDLEGVEWRLYEIPVIPMGYDLWHDDWLDLKEPAPYLLHMCYSRCGDDDPSAYDTFTELYPDQQTPQYLEPLRLLETLRQMALPEPLDALPDLIAMLHHCTGHFWLDEGELSLLEGGGYPLWQPDEVAWLAAEWQKAEPVLAHVQRLLDWQSGSSREIAVKLTAVRDALLNAYQQT